MRPLGAWRSKHRGAIRTRSTLVVWSFVGAGLSACSTELSPAPAPPTEAPLKAGEVCTSPAAEQLTARFSPARIFVSPCDEGECPSRSVELRLDPDVCENTAVQFSSTDAAIVAPPNDAAFNLHAPSLRLNVAGGKMAGRATITASIVAGGLEKLATLEVISTPATLPTCTGNTAGPSKVEDGGVFSAHGASVGLQQGASKPNAGSFLWSAQPFDATIGCAASLASGDYTALGPSIAFGPTTAKFQRDIPLVIPVSPSLLPEGATLRHVEVLYSSPGFVTPRPVPVADLRMLETDAGWGLSFKAPRLGTYQAVVKRDAGSSSILRRFTHRAAIGVSMGGGGVAMTGFRNHHLFDALAPLGGPVDWSWAYRYIEENILAGFRPIQPGTTLESIPLSSQACETTAECQPDETCIGSASTKKCVILPPPRDPYEHTQSFNTIWYEFPRAGAGGTFDRVNYFQMFRDLSLIFGNLISDNLLPGATNLPAGVPPTDATVTGGHENGECNVWLKPLDGPDHDAQLALDTECPVDRCAHTLSLNNYFDREFNPDGAFPVITVCDTDDQNADFSPYANWWVPAPRDYPLEVMLAVDYNANGVRDELEPVIQAGHEPWSDVGIDGIASAQEPGYLAGVNEDPAGDDYNAQYNPSGTEDDGRYQQGEPFEDVGLDGVAGTPQQAAGGYDVGESDGAFTMSRGLSTLMERDSRSILHAWAKGPGGTMTDEALARLDVWTDGGLRDFFNFAVTAQHLTGSLVTRGRSAQIYTDFNQAPGLESLSTGFDPAFFSYPEMSGVVFQRYGKIDPNEQDIENGSGQHVGTIPEITSRLQAALYFIGSRWRDPGLRRRVAESVDKPAEGAKECEITGSCRFDFTASDGRKGPVSVSLPPGYAHADLQEQRYPVIYLLHGYGQTPQDLEGAILFLKNWMNSSGASEASRLPKAILVYLDGRCRPNTEGSPECIRGNFYTNSVRPGGAQLEDWWLELIDYVDQNYRTKGEAFEPWTP